ncbi:MAG TPA: undecaprenyl-diphosphate phosphatase [Clostridia bacterium]|nr:undecaprenyl-diphosphate phosphatase [Clostridia bacterium]
MLNLIKAIIFGIVEGITEWLPISSTGHMILLDEIIKLQVSEAFMEMYLVVIQLGAIMAVVVLYWQDIFPFKFKPFSVERQTMIMWFKILFASIPAGVIGILFKSTFYKYFYNSVSVALALIIVGVLFIYLENKNKDREAKIVSIRKITYKDAFIVGIFQLFAAIFPGTSRSGATILGGIYLGFSRQIAAEFTFFMAIPAMFGASVLELRNFGMFSFFEFFILIVSMVVSYLTSVYVIRFLMNYIKKHDFKAFGWYRIGLGLLVLLVSFITK